MKIIVPIEIDIDMKMLSKWYSPNDYHNSIDDAIEDYVCTDFDYVDVFVKNNKLLREILSKEYKKYLTNNK